MEVYKEAHLLAFQIQSNEELAAQAAQSKDPGSQEVEGFIQESKLKINLFDRENEGRKAPSHLSRRHTACPTTSGWHPCPGTQPASPEAAPPAAPAQTSCPETSGPLPASCPQASRAQCCSASEIQAGSEEGHQQVTAARTSSFRGKSLHSGRWRSLRDRNQSSQDENPK